VSQPVWRVRLNSGELAAVAARCANRQAMASHYGVMLGTLKTALNDLGTSFERLRAAGDDFGDEEPTNPAAQVFDVSDAPQLLENLEPLRHLPLLPPGHRYSGVSTLLDGDGKVRAQWQKTNVSKEQYREALLQAVSEICEPMRGAYEPIAPPVDANDQLMSVYTMGDPHLGMMSWREETGNDHDLAAGRRDLIAAVDHLVGVAEPSGLGVVLSLGDLVHFDNESGTTTKGTRQDADTRWYKVMRATIDTSRRCIDRALEKHRKVRAIFIRGNHDKHASAAVAMALACAYEREPRVEIDQSPDPFSWIRFGKVLIGANHSEEASKPETLAGVMACDRPEDWGACLYRYILCGHLHHTWAKEAMGVLVERFPTLAPKDAYHHAHGYRAGQSMCVDTYDAEFGRLGRRYVGIRQLRAA
jgi:hypothetical protein